MRNMKRLIYGIIIVTVLSFIVTPFIGAPSYSEGNRVGTFSVIDDKIVKEIENAMVSSKSVELSYTERLWKPYNANTSYIITRVKILN